jgi:hypothetical protein
MKAERVQARHGRQPPWFVAPSEGFGIELCPEVRCRHQTELRKDVQFAARVVDAHHGTEPTH